MAEKEFEQSFHQTQPDRFYDDVNPGSHSDGEIKVPPPEFNPYYALHDPNAPHPSPTVPPMPAPRSMMKIPNLANFKPSLYDG